MVPCAHETPARFSKDNRMAAPPMPAGVAAMPNSEESETDRLCRYESEYPRERESKKTRDPFKSQADTIRPKSRPLIHQLKSSRCSRVSGAE
ncbi:MAG: hypothetical protein BWY77_01965 [bacterium ADurb.Bin431]|nr:MAG: hypothetical protein BWY77_01965 [bacterium ADurb.Bin431]